MANNIISDWLETYALYSDTPEQEAATRYAAQLDRLVEAARRLLRACEDIDDDVPTLDEPWGELESIISDIELERK